MEGKINNFYLDSWEFFGASRINLICYFVFFFRQKDMYLLSQLDLLYNEAKFVTYFHEFRIYEIMSFVHEKCLFFLKIRHFYRHFYLNRKLIYFFKKNTRKISWKKIRGFVDSDFVKRCLEHYLVQVIEHRILRIPNILFDYFWLFCPDNSFKLISK